MKTRILHLGWLWGVVAAPALALGQAEEPRSPEFDAVRAITGTYAAEGRTLHIAEVPCSDRACLYFELTEPGGELTPLRQWVWSLRSDDDGSISAVMYAFPERLLERFMPTPADVAIGMWAAPEHFPAIDLDTLRPMGVVEITTSGDGLAAEAPARLILHQDAARSITFGLEAHDGLVWRERWFDSAGETIDVLEMTFERTELTTPVEVTPEGLVKIDLRVGRGVELAAGDFAVVEFNAYRATNGQLVDSTRLEGRKAEQLQPAPGNLFEGFSQGVLGMRATDRAALDGTSHVRRLIVPAVLAFGDRGRAVVPPGDMLIVDIDLLTLRDLTRD